MIVSGNNCFFASNLPQSPLNLNFWIFLVTMRLLTQFQPKIGATKLRRKAKFCPT